MKPLIKASKRLNQFSKLILKSFDNYFIKGRTTTLKSLLALPACLLLITYVFAVGFGPIIIFNYLLNELGVSKQVDQWYELAAIFIWFWFLLLGRKK